MSPGRWWRNRREDIEDIEFLMLGDCQFLVSAIIRSSKSDNRIGEKLTATKHRRIFVYVILTYSLSEEQILNSRREEYSRPRQWVSLSKVAVLDLNQQRLWTVLEIAFNHSRNKKKRIKSLAPNPFLLFSTKHAYKTICCPHTHTHTHIYTLQYIHIYIMYTYTYICIYTHYINIYIYTLQKILAQPSKKAKTNNINNIYIYTLQYIRIYIMYIYIKIKHQPSKKQKQKQKKQQSKNKINKLIKMIYTVYFYHSGLPLRARVDLGAVAIKGYSTFPKAPALLEPQHQMEFNVVPRTLNNFKYCFLILIILFNIIHSFAHSLIVHEVPHCSD